MGQSKGILFSCAWVGQSKGTCYFKIAPRVSLHEMLHEYCAMNIALWILLCEDLLCEFCSVDIALRGFALWILLLEYCFAMSGCLVPEAGGGDCYL